MIVLTSRVGIGVPSTTDISVPTDTSSYVEETTRKLCRWFGGAIIDKRDGGYIANNGDLITEPIFWVISYCTTQQLEDYLVQVVIWAKTICKELRQENVAIIINNSMVLVSAA